MPETRLLSGTVTANRTVPASQRRKVSGTALPERESSKLRDQKENLRILEAFMRQEHFEENKRIRTVPDNFDNRECEVLVSDDSYEVVTGEIAKDNVLCERKTTARIEDSLNSVVKKQLFGGTGRKLSENLQAGTVVRKLSFNLENKVGHVTYKENKAFNQRKPESGNSGSPGTQEQTGKRKKLETRAVPQESTKKVSSYRISDLKKSIFKTKQKMYVCSTVDKI